MIRRSIATMALLSLAGCGAVQQQQGALIVRDAQANLQVIVQNCLQQMQGDRDLDPIRSKIELSRSGISGAPPPAMLADRSRPTQEEKVAIGRWEAIREACVQQEIQYGLSLTLPANLEPLRNKLLTTGRETNQRTGLLVAALYDGRMTYGEFAAARMKNTDEMVGSLTGKSPSTVDQPYGVASPAVTMEDQIPLRKEGNSYYVPVSVNGFPPMEFVLDSGADVVQLPREVVLTLVRAGTLQSNDLIAPTTIGVASGAEFQSVAFRIRELRVGRHVIRNVTGIVSPTGTSALLGGSFLSRFASWSIDNQRSALLLSP